MSICQQAIRARRKARLDPRYKSGRIGDALASARRLAAKIERERRIKSGSGKKK